MSEYHRVLQQDEICDCTHCGCRIFDRVYLFEDFDEPYCSNQCASFHDDDVDDWNMRNYAGSW